MNRLLVAAASFSLALAGLANVALARENVQGITTNADGSNVSSTAGVNPTANGGGGTIIYGDINTGPGYTVVTPPSVDYTAAPPAPAPAAAPEPVYEEPIAEAPVDSAVADTAVASDTDLDADNLADSLEWDLGLDPGLADTDGDGVADGDELNIYGTEATVWDTDGDSVSDGEELFGTQTDPLVWDDFSAADGGVETVAQQATEPQSFDEATPVEPVQSLPQGTNEIMTATDGDASAVGPGNASASPGTVTRGGNGTALLGPDGTYRVTDNAPANVSVSGDTNVISPPAGNAPDTSSVPTCSSYGSWYDAQIAYETAGLTDADPALVSNLDPDYDGIACEEGM